LIVVALGMVAVDAERLHGHGLVVPVPGDTGNVVLVDRREGGFG
jgi:hypothetical protein